MTNETKPFKRCACGRVYETREDYERLPDSKIYDDADGSLLDQRLCACGSHIVAALVPAMTADELRRAVRVVDSMNETFNDEFSAAELLRLVKVCWSSGWDVLPDAWTTEQVGRALTEGRAPRFEETRDGLHALDVSDCRCRGCREDRLVADAEATIDAVFAKP